MGLYEPDGGLTMSLREIKDGEFVKPVIACDPKIRGLAICHTDGYCSSCGFAAKYRDEHPEEFQGAD